MQMTACFRCHGHESDAEAPGDCFKCHTSDFDLKPRSHETTGFYQAGGDSRGHADLALEERQRIESLRTEGATGHVGPLSSIDYCSTCHLLETFCVTCHEIEMPHPATFVDGHGEVGRRTPEVCANCHGTEVTDVLEFCNACHHDQGDPSQPWIPQHFDVVREQGAEGCFDCHNPTFCAACHVRGLR